MKKKRQSLTKHKKSLVPSKIIGLDLDGVILDHTKMRIRLAKKRGFVLKPNQTPSDILRKKVPSPHRQIIQYYLYNHPKTSLQSPLMSKAKMALDKLKAGKIPFYLISRRQTPEIAIKLMKLRGLWPTYFGPKNTHFVFKNEDKNAKAKELGITHFVDDEMPVIAQMAAVKNRFLFDPHKALKRGEYTKVRSWPELLEHFLD